MDKTKKIKVVALVGMAGSGKDTILNWVVSHNPDLHKIVGYTSRPARANEKEGTDYYFKDNHFMLTQMLGDFFIDFQEFNSWYYAHAFSELDPDKINVGIFNLKAIEQALMDGRLDVSVVYIHADDKTRLLRQLNREPNPNCKEIVRRFNSDFDDYEKSFLSNDLFIDNDNKFEVADNAAPLIKFIASLKDDKDRIN